MSKTTDPSPRFSKASLLAAFLIVLLPLAVVSPAPGADRCDAATSGPSLADPGGGPQRLTEEGSANAGASKDGEDPDVDEVDPDPLTSVPARILELLVEALRFLGFAPELGTRDH